MTIITKEDFDAILYFLNKYPITDYVEANITRYARKYGINQGGGAEYNRKMLKYLLSKFNPIETSASQE